MTPANGKGQGMAKFISLRTKFVWFLSLIIVLICSSLSWYFIQNKTDSLTKQLINLGSILVKNLAYNSRYGVFTEDEALMSQLIDGVMEVEEVEDETAALNPSTAWL